MPGEHVHWCLSCRQQVRHQNGVTGERPCPHCRAPFVLSRAGDPQLSHEDGRTLKTLGLCLLGLLVVAAVLGALAQQAQVFLVVAAISTVILAVVAVLALSSEGRNKVLLRSRCGCCNQVAKRVSMHVESLGTYVTSEWREQRGTSTTPHHGPQGQTTYTTTEHVTRVPVTVTKERLRTYWACSSCGYETQTRQDVTMGGPAPSRLPGFLGKLDDIMREQQR